MHALIHRSLADVPQIILTVVSIFSVGFLVWFLAGLLGEERRMRAGQVPIFRFTGERALKFRRRYRKRAHAPGTVLTKKARTEAAKVQVFSAADLCSPKDAVKDARAHPGRIAS